MKEFKLHDPAAYYKCTDCGIMSRTLQEGLCSRCRTINELIETAHREGFDEGYRKALEEERQE